MRRVAFTLVELLVVVAVISLLVAMVLPSMNSVYSLARATICRSNLQHLSDAFAMSGSAKTLGGGRPSIGRVMSAFPKSMGWPAVPRDAVDDPEIYQCPEEPVKTFAVGDMFKLLEYKNPYGRFPMNRLNGASSFYKSRTGSDDKGSYTDYLLQDDYGNGQFEMMDFHGWIDTDGVVRVYHTGHVFVYDRIPNTPEWSGSGNRGPGYPDRVNTCGDVNAIYWRGQPAWASNNGGVQKVRGQTFALPGWDPGYTNYGINSYAHWYAFGSKIIVLVDYKELIVEVDDPQPAGALLAKSARHLGKVNQLRADGSVRTDYPADVSPLLHPKLWNPDVFVNQEERP